MREIKFRAWDKENKCYIKLAEHPQLVLRLSGKLTEGSTTPKFILEQYTGLCYEGDYVVMDCWNGGDGIDEESIHDIFEGVVVYDKKICRFGLQTKLCDKGQIEVGLEDNQFTSIEIIGNTNENSEMLRN